MNAFSRAAAVYRHFDASGRLLYIGCSMDPARRFGVHRCVAPWARQVANITLEWFDSREEAEAAEAAAIARENPPHNRHGRSDASRRWVVFGYEGLSRWIARSGLTEGEVAAQLGIKVKRLRLMVEGRHVPNGRLRWAVRDMTGGAVNGDWGWRSVSLPPDQHKRDAA